MRFELFTYLSQRGPLAGWRLITNVLVLSFINAYRLIALLGLIYIGYSFWDNSTMSIFNFSFEESLIIFGNYCLYLILCSFWYAYRLRNPEILTLNENGLSYCKYNFFLKKEEAKYNWCSIKSITIQRITNPQSPIPGTIKFVLKTISNKNIELPDQLPDIQTHQLRCALDGFITKHNPDIELFNLDTRQIWFDTPLFKL